MRSQKVVHISTVHHYLDVRIFEKMCKSLSKSGYEVSLLIQHDGDIKTSGVSIIGLPTSKRKMDRITKVIPSMLKKVLKLERAAILHLHDPELLLFGVFFKLLGFKVIYDVHEDLPKDILSKDWIPSYLRKMLSFIVKWFEYFITSMFDGVVTVTEPINNRFMHTNNIMIRNFPKLDVFYEQKLSVRSNYVIYVGDITIIRGAKEMVSALQIDSGDLRLKLLGRVYPESLKKELVEISSNNNVDFLGWVSHSELPDLLSNAICGLVVLHPIPGYMEAYSVKMFEYMASGLPIIASDFPLWREIIENGNCGILVNPLDPLEISKAVKFLIENPGAAREMGKNGRKAAIDNYSWEREEEKLLAFYASVLNK